MSHMGHSEFEFEIPKHVKPKLKCKTCKHFTKDTDEKNKFWCVQSRLENMWHATEPDGFCYFHSKWNKKAFE